MAYPSRSIIFNGQADLTNQFVYWSFNRAFIRRSVELGVPVFVLRSSGTMTQRIDPARFLAITPENFLFKLRFRSPVQGDSTILQASLTLRINFVGGDVDQHIFPLQAFTEGWHSLEDVIISMPAAETGAIEFIDVIIRNNSNNEMEFQSTELYYSLTSADPDQGDPYDASLMILYGLEADLPRLR